MSLACQLAERISMIESFETVDSVGELTKLLEPATVGFSDAKPKRALERSSA